LYVGVDKDSDKRQRAAIEGFAKRVGFDLDGEFNDAAVSGGWRRMMSGYRQLL
jgi:hypothetical protein